MLAAKDLQRILGPVMIYVPVTAITGSLAIALSAEAVEVGVISNLQWIRTYKSELRTLHSWRS